MNILFRCDAGPVRGSGHLVRCLTLADALSKKGCSVTFACRADAGPFLNLFKDRPYTLHTLPAPAVALSKTEDIWSDAEQRDDFALCAKAVGEEKFDCVIIDHYALSRAWEMLARSLGAKIVAIDDLANRPHECDVLLDQNAYTDKDSRYDGLVPESCTLLLGGRYALLRDEFRVARKSIGPVRDHIRTVTILMGGSDYRGQTLRLIRILKPVVAASGIGVNVILGQQNGDKDAIAELIAGTPSFRMHVNHGHIAQLMQETDIAFGAGGTSTWEFCCLGVPMLLISFSENQIKLARDGDTLGLASYLGHYDQVSDQDIEDAFKNLMADHARRKTLHDTASAAIDGNGADRVALEIIGEATFKLRKADESDCLDLLEWRNDPLTRAMSVQTDPVALETHRLWFEDSLLRPERILLIAESKGQKIGVVRFDIAGNTAKVSINLNPVWRGCGMSSQILKRAEESLPRDVKMVHAEIKTGNEASIRTFETAGYSFNSTINGLNLYIKKRLVV